MRAALRYSIMRQPKMEKPMNWDIIKGKWKQAAGAAKSKWGELTDDDLQQIAGEREQLVGKIQEKYGISKDQAEKEVDDWSRSV
ncbi:hypothetical protein ROS217_16025 [Roseovarius sp. 217]|nr:hypothetical protein ROS217_16025 [Roseovarius sp. 217]